MLPAANPLPGQFQLIPKLDGIGDFQLQLTSIVRLVAIRVLAHSLLTDRTEEI